MGALFGPINGIVQLQRSAITANTTTASATFATIAALTINLTTSGGNLVYLFSGCSSNSSTTATTVFRIQLDGVTVVTGGGGTDGGSLSAANVARAVPLVEKSVLVAAGAHTVTLQWRTTAGTARINPGTNDFESAVLLVAEVRV